MSTNYSYPRYRWVSDAEPKAKRRRLLQDDPEPYRPRRKRDLATTPSYPAASLLGLPRELRDQIYHEIWNTKKPFSIDYKRARFIVGYGGHPLEKGQWTKQSKMSKVKIPWFLANSQVLDEAIEQFNRNGHWMFDSTFGANLPPKARFQGFGPRMEPKSLLNPWNAHTLYLGNVLIWAKQGRATCELYLPAEVFKDVNPSLVASPSLRHLNMSLTLAFCDAHIDPSRPITYDFGPLAKWTIPSLRTAEIKVSFGDHFNQNFSTVNDGIREDSEVINHFREEAYQLGMRIIRDGAMEQFDIIEPGTNRTIFGFRTPRWCYRFVKN